MYAFVKTLELHLKVWIVLNANNAFILKILKVDFFFLFVSYERYRFDNLKFKTSVYKKQLTLKLKEKK